MMMRHSTSTDFVRLPFIILLFRTPLSTLHTNLHTLGTCSLLQMEPKRLNFKCWILTRTRETRTVRVTIMVEAGCQKKKRTFLPEQCFSFFRIPLPNKQIMHTIAVIDSASSFSVFTCSLIQTRIFRQKTEFKGNPIHYAKVMHACVCTNRILFFW